MAIDPVPAFPFPRRPFSSITPFTYSDAMTHLELLEKLRVYAGVILPDEINKVLDEYSVEITAEVQAAIDLMIGTLNDKIIEINDALADQQADYTQKISDLTAYVDDAVQQIINSTIEVSDPVINGVIGDTATRSREEIVNISHTNLFGKLGRLYGALAKINERPVIIGIYGSSTSNGSWGDRLISGMRAAYPLDSADHPMGVLTHDEAVTHDFSEPGLYLVKGGIGGTRAADYLVGRYSQVGAIGFDAILHMVGSNDYGDHNPPSTYSNQLNHALNRVAEESTVTPLNILIQPFQQSTNAAQTSPYSWEDYGHEQYRLSVERDDAAFIDVSADYYAAGVGIGLPDPLGLMNSDNLHLRNAGYRMLADTIARKLGVAYRTVDESASFNIPPRVHSYTGFSDTGRGSDDPLSGTSADRFVGGEISTWGTSDTVSAFVRSAAGFRASSFPSLTGFVGVAAPDTFAAFTFRVVRKPTVGRLFVDMWRGTDSGTGTPDGLRVVVDVSGLYFMVRRDGVSENLMQPIPYPQGAVIRGEYYRGYLSLFINGQPVWSKYVLGDVFSVSFSGYSGLSHGPVPDESQFAVIRDLIIETLY